MPCKKPGLRVIASLTHADARTHACAHTRTRMHARARTHAHTRTRTHARTVTAAVAVTSAAAARQRHKGAFFTPLTASVGVHQRRHPPALQDRVKFISLAHSYRGYSPQCRVCTIVHPLYWVKAYKGEILNTVMQQQLTHDETATPIASNITINAENSSHTYAPPSPLGIGHRGPPSLESRPSTRLPKM